MSATASLAPIVSPGLAYMIGGLLVPLLRPAGARGYVLALPIAVLGYALMLPEGHHATLAFAGFEFELLRIDRLSTLFVIVFLIAAFIGNLFAWHDDDPVQRTAAQLYIGSTLAAVQCGDLASLFVFWELTGIASVFLIWARGSERAFRAGLRYLLVQVGSGVILLAGLLIHASATGSLAFDHIGLDAPGGKLIVLAFGIKCAFPLLHNWLQDTYPEATVSGTVILSSFTTKLAIYALARGFAGTEMLVPIGAVMAMFPIFFAVIENDLRRVLAYSLNNQLGFMVVGIGIGTELALNGAVAHAFADIIFKALLFMAMGAVLFRTGTVNGTDLGGLYKTMPWTAGFCIVGAASISAFPLFSAFATKSMVMTAAAEQGRWGIWAALLFASAGVFHHAGIKIPYFAFFAHDSGKRPEEAPLSMLVAMGIAAALCVGIGVWPESLYALLPFPVDYRPYTVSHVVNQLQLLLFSALAFTFLMRSGIYPPEMRSVNLDTDWLYRRLMPDAAGAILRALTALGRNVAKSFLEGLAATLRFVSTYHGPDGVFARDLQVGAMAMVVVAALAAYLVFYFIFP